jgi:glutamyl-tRNA synthetase
VSDFADMGYLPEAMRNYLARLGWGHGDDEIFTDLQAISWFDVADVVRAPARLDWAKLNHLNNHYIRAADEGRLTDLAVGVLARDGGIPSPDDRARLAATIPLVREGAKTIPELLDLCRFALKRRPLELDDKARALLTEEARGRLGRLAQALAEAGDWSVNALGPALRAFAAAEGVGLGVIGPALRGVLTGGTVAPDLASTLAALGKQESLGRMEDALSHVR